MEKQKNKQLSKLIKKILMKIIFSKVFLIIIAVVLIALILVSAIKYILDLDISVYDDTKKGNVPFEVSEYIKGAKIDENGIYFEKQDATGKVQKATVEDMWKDIIKNGTDIDKYLDNYEEFEKLIDAEVITQFPYIGVGKGKLDGSIKFQRHYSNNKEKTLSYINLDTFDNYIKSSDEKVLDYFTLDSDGNAIIAVKNEQKESLTTDDPSCNPSSYSQNLGGSGSGGSYSYEKVSIEKQSLINYKMFVQQYTMPFQFLWSLLVIGQDKDFVLELADLVADSEIVISIYDNETRVDSTEVYTREETIKVKKKNENSIEQSNKGESNQVGAEDEYEEKTVTYTTTYKSTSITDTPEIALTKANVWIVDYEQEYEYQDSTSAVPNSNNPQGENNITVSSNVVTKNKKYISKPAKTKTKDDKNSSEPNFVNILLKKIYKYAKDNIVNSAEELFDILEKNPDTVNMVDLMRYLLYKVTGESYGVTDYDFSAYDAVNFENTTGSASDLLVEYIHYFEHSTPPPTSSDGKKYIVETDGKGHPTVGYGVDIYNCGYLKLFQQAGYSLNVGAEIDKDFVDGIEEKVMQGKINAINSQLSGLNLTEYQINALVSRAYNCGTSGAIGTRNGKNFAEAYKAYWDENKDDKFKKKDSNADYSHKLYTEYMDEPIASNLPGLKVRRESEWTLFQTGYYTTLKKWHSEGGGSIIEVAEKIHSYMEQNNYTYCVYGGNSYEECKGGGHGLSKTFEASKSAYHHSCCATYVSWVLQEAGYLSDSEHSDSAAGLQSIMKNKGYKMITNKSDLKPGDVLCYSGHVEIYAGNNKIYNAGSGSAIRNAAPANLSRSFSYALRPVKK